MQPSKPAEPLVHTLEVTRPLEAVSIDLGYLKGDHFLVMVDRYSGWPEVQKMTKLDTKAVTEVLKTWFMQHGRPNRIRSDGGPQFRGGYGHCTQADLTLQSTSKWSCRGSHR